jgi:hypothetical protein
MLILENFTLNFCFSNFIRLFPLISKFLIKFIFSILPIQASILKDLIIFNQGYYWWILNLSDFK